ncbi:MAG: hypothetical protein HC806_01770 [Anaerolineae bacterium]|nr:hypothetical protein [Anaerolineae bacterium]
MPEHYPARLQNRRRQLACWSGKTHPSDGTEKLILCAGVRNFREPWARDTGFACFGLIELEEYQATKEALEVFLLTQSEDGQFPVKIHSTHFLERYLYSVFNREQPIDRPIAPRYITAHNTISLDGNSLLIIAILNYALRTGDYAFVSNYWDQLKHALAWLETHVKESDGLLHQGAFTDWADSIARQGKVLYTNVIYWRALLDMAEVAQICGNLGDRHTLGEKARQVRVAINEHFWRPDLGYYVTSQFFDNLSSSGNLLAISWGLASPEQSHTILDAMRYFGMGTPVPTKPSTMLIPKVHRPRKSAWRHRGLSHLLCLALAGCLARHRPRPNGTSGGSPRNPI